MYYTKISLFLNSIFHELFEIPLYLLFILEKNKEMRNLSLLRKGKQTQSMVISYAPLPGQAEKEKLDTGHEIGDLWDVSLAKPTGYQMSIESTFRRS